jgi:hydroxymethylbilane synthase
MQSKFTIGTRGSKLALWQAEFVRNQLLEVYPQFEIRLEIIKTFGDKIQNASLTEIGGKGVFTKELEIALLDNRIDLAVHSLKDLPTVLPAELQLAAALKREDVRDALVLRSDLQIETPSLKTLPANATVGTSSLRRASQLKNLRPDIEIKDIRGNVETRLKKLDSGEYDAILLAVAGLKRLGYESRISAYLTLDEMLPQVGQGALGIETRMADSETNRLVSALTEAETFACVLAERAFLRGLGGGCQFPIAAYAIAQNEQLNLQGLVATPSGEHILRNKATGAMTQPEKTGETLARKLLSEGAANLINLRA